MPTASITITKSQVRISGHGFTPGSFAGVALLYASTDQARSFAGDIGVLEGLIQATYEVDGDGNVALVASLFGYAGSSKSGRFTGALATTAGELVRLLALFSAV